MEYKLLEKADLELMKEVLEDDNMIFNIDYLSNFLEDKNAFGFIAKLENRIIGFAYAYTLLRPDGKSMVYLHSIGILPEYQNSGYGTELLTYIKNYSNSIGCSEMFVITDKNEYENEIVYVYDFEGDK